MKNALTFGMFAVCFLLGAGAGAGAMRLRDPKPRPPAATKDKGDRDDDDDDSLAQANVSLVKSLQECNRRLAAKGDREVPAPVAAVAPSAPNQAEGRRGRSRDRDTAPDWEALAKEGAVPFRVPCLRSTPFVPSQRQLDRLGLAPSDADTLREAYAKSNERMTAQLTPLCAKVVGGADVAARIGPQACLRAITDSARKESPDKMKAALTRVAEVNGGKRTAPKGVEGLEPVEALMLAMADEQRAFEKDLAAKYGPEDAARIAGSRALCSERGLVRADDSTPREAPPR